MLNAAPRGLPSSERSMRRLVISGRLHSPRSDHRRDPAVLAGVLFGRCERHEVRARGSTLSFTGCTHSSRSASACGMAACGHFRQIARRIHRIAGLSSIAQLSAANLPPYKPFDRRHVPGANWARISGTRSLHGSTIGIIGLGEIGREIAVRAAAFEMKVLYFQRTRLGPGEEASLRASYRPLDALLAQSDWVVPQLPGDPSTRHLINGPRLALMKRGACLINVSRADVVERDALIAALRSGHLGGFALDPLYAEPGRADDELLDFDNVILTPHMAGSPRTNGLQDIAELITGLAEALFA